MRGKQGRIGFLGVFAVLAMAGWALGAGSEDAKPIAVPPPPMGWSSWNSFSNSVDAQIVMEQRGCVAPSLRHLDRVRVVNQLLRQ